MKEETNPKYMQLLATGRELFWKYGFKKVSIQEICERAGISKMTYYRFFENKVELAKAVFDKEASQGVVEVKNILKEKSLPSEKIKKIIMMKQNGTTGISKEFLKDFYTSSGDGLKEFIEEKTKKLWQEMLVDFKKAQKKGVFRKDMKPEFLFFMSQKGSEMITDERLLRLYKNPQDLLVEFSNFVAYGISPHK
ncbi:TetR/AcrR family transcriptional regulator [Aurantibacillus circumpalustris]|uniref:TetR/AcrR family transcriptional regulator n=1 Tax=Aurantibacillus circumpalustris TaxID=3036359 RepID=UPI00295A80B9|nr:TetR/AcrR family transcriptional regulator [Aurantibacillus circumpalustris]